MEHKLVIRLSTEDVVTLPDYVDDVLYVKTNNKLELVLSFDKSKKELRLFPKKDDGYLTITYISKIKDRDHRINELGI